MIAQIGPSSSGRGQGEGLRIWKDLKPSPGAPARWLSRRPLPVGEGLACGIVSGILLVLSLPKPDLYPLAWIALTPWLYVIGGGPTLRHTLAVAYAAGVVFFAGTFYWISETMAIYGGLSITLAIGVGALFVIVFALYF